MRCSAFKKGKTEILNLGREFFSVHIVCDNGKNPNSEET